MANINNTSSYMDEDKKQIIKESNYTYRDALEVSEMQIADLQKELEQMDKEE